jgi:glycosyltransferase involved in cell wall biosynthesis
MRFSIFTPESNGTATHGYGVAALGMIKSLESLGHTVARNDPTAPVEIAFCQPYLWDWSSKDSYKIGYVPWESTSLPESWIGPMLTTDEIWTTSPWCQRVFDKHGFPDVHIFQHGIETTGDDGWTRKRRRPEGRPIRFLHIGEPAPRKGGQLVYDTFVEAFGDRTDVSLTIKAHEYNSVRGLTPLTVAADGNVYVDPSAGSQKNVKLLTDEMSVFDLIDLVRRHDVLVYPSWGEGFGLIPLQAMVTGMPTICTANWAPYRHLLLPELRLPSKLTQSPWPDMHPGNMYEPDAVALKSMMVNLADPLEYQNASVRAYAKSFQVEQEYDWLKLTADAFEHIFENFAGPAFE